MSRPLAALALVAAAVALGAGCGSDEPKTFDEDGFAITFEYPGNFERTTDVKTNRGVGDAEESVALAMSEDNAIFVQRYGLNRTVTPELADAVTAHQISGMMRRPQCDRSAMSSASR